MMAGASPLPSPVSHIQYKFATLSHSTIIRFEIVTGLNEIVADTPSFTVNVLVFPRIVFPLYEAVPLPDALIDNV
jgi:hypothetical protein